MIDSQDLASFHLFRDIRNASILLHMGLLMRAGDIPTNHGAYVQSPEGSRKSSIPSGRTKLRQARRFEEPDDPGYSTVDHGRSERV